MIRALRQRAGKRQPVAGVEARVLAELRDLRARVPYLTGALAASADGLLLAQDTSGVEADQVAALVTTSLGIALRVAHASGQGSGLREVLIRGSEGYVATYPAGRSTVLTLFAQDQVNVGRLHLEGRRTGRRIGELLGEFAGDPVQDPAVHPADEPPKSPAQAKATTAPSATTAEAAPTRISSARASRTSHPTPNARPTTDS